MTLQSLLDLVITTLRADLRCESIIEASPLRGDPVLDLPVVAQEVAKLVEPTPQTVQLDRRMRK